MTYEVNHKGMVLVGDTLGQPPATMFMLHGSNSHRGNLSFMRHALLKHGISTMAFDMPGCGDSISNGESNLCTYLEAQMACYDSMTKRKSLRKNCTIFGSSRGAHTALRMAVQLQNFCPRLILSVPAFYSKDCERIDLGADHGAIKNLRLSHMPNFYISKLAHELSETTKVLTILASKDIIVDNYVTRYVFKGKAKEYLVESASHILRDHFESNDIRPLATAINDFIFSMNT